MCKEKGGSLVPFTGNILLSSSHNSYNLKHKVFQYMWWILKHLNQNWTNQYMERYKRKLLIFNLSILIRNYKSIKIFTTKLIIFYSTKFLIVYIIDLQVRYFKILLILFYRYQSMFLPNHIHIFHHYSVFLL